MKKHLISAFWSSLIISVLVVLMTSVIPRIFVKGYYSANLVEGMKMSAYMFAVVFVIAFFAFLIVSLWNEHKTNKALKNKKNNKRTVKHKH